jgi:hypothetical protein
MLSESDETLLAQQAAALKRMIAELEQTLGASAAATVIMLNLLQAYEAIRRAQEVRR